MRHQPITRPFIQLSSRRVPSMSTMYSTKHVSFFSLPAFISLCELSRNCTLRWRGRRDGESERATNPFPGSPLEKSWAKQERRTASKVKASLFGLFSSQSLPQEEQKERWWQQWLSWGQAVVIFLLTETARGESICRCTPGTIGHGLFVSTSQLAKRITGHFFTLVTLVLAPLSIKKNVDWFTWPFGQRWQSLCRLIPLHPVRFCICYSMAANE